jgi:hypothetical protein
VDKRIDRAASQAYVEWTNSPLYSEAIIEEIHTSVSSLKVFEAGWNAALQSVERRRTVRPKRAVQQATNGESAPCPKHDHTKTCWLLGGPNQCGDSACRLARHQ